jgi:hypothetical protein
MRNRVIVKAVLGGLSKPEQGSGQRELKVAPGETGLMYWVVVEHFRSPEPRVIWDTDPARVPRTVLLQEVEVIGIERNGRRMQV